MRFTKNAGAKMLGAVLAIMALLMFSFGTGAQTLAPVAGFWNSSVRPASTTGDDSQSVELGMKFKANVAGSISAIRFYKATNSRGTHTGTIWTSTGTRLASVTFTGETASGWQMQALPAPLPISAGTTYVVSYHTVQYAWDSPFFTQALTAGPLTAPANAGVYAYGSTVRFPASTWKASNYWVDVLFQTSTTPAPSAPLITSQPVSRTVTAGQTASFSVNASGTAPFTYQWSKNGAAISGATSSSYTTAVTTTSDNGAQFTATVANSVGSITSNAAVLTVNAAMVAPSITSQPVSSTVVAGQNVSFSISASGSSALNYQWKKNGAAISGATSPNYNMAATMSDNNAQFSCTVSNSAGSITSNAAMLTVNAAMVAPSITSQPVSSTVVAGQNVSFSIGASGSSTLNYQWKKNGAAISGATSPNYNMAATMSDNNAQFSCTVSNSAGSATSNAAMLTVNAATVVPSITSQPASRTVTAGQTASFSVSVSGTAPFTYQWNKNGAAINGATSSTYTMTAATSDSGAQFAVTVSNSAGNITSNNATLTVNAGTLLLSANPASLSFGNIDLGATATKQVTLTNSGTANVTLSGMSLSGSGFTASGVSSGAILTPGQTATMSINFKPAAAGAVTGSVTVNSNAAAVIVDLSGSGVQAVSHTVSVNWTRSTSTVSGYLVYTSQVSGGPYTKLTASAVSLPSFSDSSVQNGKTYYYVVTAVDASGTESTYSNEAAAIIQ